MASLALVKTLGTRTPAETEATQDFSDEDLADLYRRFKEDGSLESIFWMGVPSLTEFLQRFHPRNAALLRIRERHSRQWVNIGLGWINGARNTKADGSMKTIEVGLGVCCKFRSLDTTLSLGHKVLDIAFGIDPSIVAAIGLTPDPNKRAVVYARLLGMDIVGTIRDYASWYGKRCGAVISHISRERFYEMQQEEG